MEAPDVIICLMGLFFVLIGFLCAKYPHLIAGVNSLKPEERAKLDLKGLGKFTRNILCLMGLAMVGAHFLFYLGGLDKRTCLVISTVLVPIVGLIPYFIGSQKYMRK